MAEGNQEHLRLFCAIELPAEVRARAARHISDLRSSLPEARVRWERAEKLHLTLKFFGSVPRDRIEEISRALARATAAVPSFSLSVEGAGAFPPRGLPQVLWLGVTDGSGQLARLQELVEEECATGCGLARERRGFHPHLTLARLKNISAAEARLVAKHHQERGFTAQEFGVLDLALVKSELLPTGSVYSTLPRHPLRG